MSKRKRAARRREEARGWQASQWATAGVCLFLLGFAAPIPSQLPLLALVGFALVATFKDSGPAKLGSPIPLMVAVSLFLVSTGVSIFLSVDPGRSLELSASWIPGVLLFVVIAERLREEKDLRALYACLSWVALALSLALLVGRWSYGPDAHSWLLEMGLPVLVVPNDIHFLALLAPFSVIVADRDPRSGLGFLGLLSIATTGLAIIALGSRGAVLVWAVGLVVTGALLRPRLGLGLGGAILSVVILGDALLGFPLASKFTHLVDTRISLWIIAWEMFLDAPWAGQGPHTFRPLYFEYFNSIDFPGWVRFDPWGTAVPWAHNLYLEVLAERGLLGLFAFLGLLAATAFYGLKTRFGGDQGAAALASGAMGCLAGIAASAIFEASFLRVWTVVLLFCVCGIVARLPGLASEAPDRAGAKARGRN